MKVAVFGDLHMGIKQDSVDWHNTAYAFADFMASDLRARGIRDVVFLGDFFHNRNTISVNTLNAANEFLKRFADFNLHMVLGNHDLYYSNDYVVSGVNLFDNFDNIRVYSRPTVVPFGSKNFVMCGWGYDPLEYSGDVLCTHLEIAMFKFNDKVAENTDGVKCSDLLRRYKLVYSGHFHLRQSKAYDSGQIRYVGNPFQMDYSDEGKKKGYEIYDTETEQIEFVENPTAPKFTRFKLSELVEFAKRDGGFLTLDSLIKGSFCKLIVDRSITLADINELGAIITAAKPMSFSHEWENGQSFSQNIGESFSVNESEFNLRNIIGDYVKCLNTSALQQEEVKGIILGYYDKCCEG